MTSADPIDDAAHQQTAVSSPATETCFAHRSWLLALVLAVITFIAYQPVWHAGFVWDDSDHLTANPAMTAPHGLKMIWSSLAISRYYPLTLTTFWIERRLWGLNPMPYHLVNILLHAVNGFLLFLVLRRLKIPAARMAAILWVLHPVNVESVAWITELKNTQSGLFFFLSVLCFLRFEADKKNHWYVFAVACGVAAMLSKPSTVVLPVVLLLCVWWERGRWERADFVRIAAFFVLATGMSALTVIEQRGQVLSAGATEAHLEPTERLVVAGKAIWFYADKVLWPARLAFVYPRWELHTSSLWSLVPTVALVALGMMLWRCRRRPWCRAVLFGGSFFVVALLPVLGFLDVFYFRYSFVADHFQYLASVGIITLVCGGGTVLCERTGHIGRYVGAVAVATLVIVLGALTWAQGHAYQDSETLWRDTETKNPNAWMPHYNRGLDLWGVGRIPEAIGEFQEALRNKPDDAAIHNDLGLAFAKLGNLQEAIEQHKEALRIKPDDAEAHNDLGAAFVKLGNPQEAIAQYKQALRLKPDYAEAHYNLGIALGQVGKVPEAAEHWEEALRLNPDYTEAHYNLGVALAQAERVPEAIRHWEQVLRLKPDDVDTHYNLGVALEKLGRTPEAIEHYQQALKLRPDFIAARDALARLQAGQ